MSYNSFVDHTEDMGGGLSLDPASKSPLMTGKTQESPTGARIYSLLEKGSFSDPESPSPPPLTNDLTQGLETENKFENLFGSTLKHTIGSCFSGMMVLGSELPFSKEEACNFLWRKYDAAQPSVTPTPMPTIATPFTKTDPCISSIVASLQSENSKPEDSPKATPPLAEAEEGIRVRVHRSKSVGLSCGSKTIAYSSGMREALEKLADEKPGSKDTDCLTADNKSEVPRYHLPPLVRAPPEGEDFKAVDYMYRTLRAEYRKVRPDTLLYESDTETQELTTLIMDMIYKEKSGCSIQALRDIVWKRGATLKTRHIVWPLILGYLPPDPAQWEETLRDKRAEYKEHIRIWYESTLDAIRKAEEYEKRTGDKMLMEDSLGLLRQIEVDILRTRPTGFTRMFEHAPVLKLLSRLLITWSKAHPKVGYFQGLNEIPTPLIVVFLMARLKNWESTTENFNALTEQDYFEVEADTYWCLSAIMDQLIPYVLSTKSSLHAEHFTVQIENIIMWANRGLYECLMKNSIGTSHYALRWTLCFMIREFPIRDSVVIWDSLISQGFSSFIQFIAANYILQFADLMMMMSVESIFIFFNVMPILWDEEGIKDFIAESKSLQEAYRRHIEESIGDDKKLSNLLIEPSESKGELKPSDKEFYEYYF